MEFPQLEAFLEAASRGSFRRAADALYLSQPSVSARVKTLEDEVGVALFHRTARGVRLTDLGRTFLPFAQRSMETLRRGREVLESVRQASAGILNMATARVIGTYVLPETLQKFHMLYPDANLHIKVGGSADVLQMVVEAEVQLGLARVMQALFHYCQDPLPDRERFVPEAHDRFSLLWATVRTTELSARLRPFSSSRAMSRPPFATPIVAAIAFLSRSTRYSRPDSELRSVIQA